QLVVKIKNDFCQWHFKIYFNSCSSEVMLIEQNPSLPNAKPQDCSNVFRLRDHLRFNVWLFNVIEFGWVGIFTRVVHHHHLSIIGENMISNVWSSGDHRHVELAI